MKKLYMEMVDYAWDLIVHAELGEGMNLCKAREQFLVKYPDNARIFDQIVTEYEEENDTKWDYECPNNNSGYDTMQEKEIDLGDKFERLKE